MHLFTQLLYTRLYWSNLIVRCVLHSRIFFHCSFFFNIWCNAQKSWPAHREHALSGPTKCDIIILIQILFGKDSAFLHDVTSGRTIKLIQSVRWLDNSVDKYSFPRQPIILFYKIVSFFRWHFLLEAGMESWTEYRIWR